MGKLHFGAVLIYVDFRFYSVPTDSSLLWIDTADCHGACSLWQSGILFTGTAAVSPPLSQRRPHSFWIVVMQTESILLAFHESSRLRVSRPSVLDNIAPLLNRFFLSISFSVL